MFWFHAMEYMFAIENIFNLSLSRAMIVVLCVLFFCPFRESHSHGAAIQFDLISFFRFIVHTQDFHLFIHSFFPYLFFDDYGGQSFKTAVTVTGFVSSLFRMLTNNFVSVFWFFF